MSCPVSTPRALPPLRHQQQDRAAGVPGSPAPTPESRTGSSTAIHHAQSRTRTPITIKISKQRDQTTSVRPRTRSNCARSDAGWATATHDSMTPWANQGGAGNSYSPMP
jgi:hypothetical protein